MLTVDRCRQLLEATDLSEQAIEEIRDALYSVARLTMAEVQRAHARIRICDIEVLEERAAICEFEGEMQRDQAEDAALIQLDAWKARKQQ